jgi:uncharacterized protein
MAGLAGAGLAAGNRKGLRAAGPPDRRRANKVTVERAVATLPDGRELATPFWRIDSGRDGPSLGMIAAQHGNEVIGAEVANRFQEVCAAQLVAGTVWLVPMANLLAVRSRRHSFDLGPEENNRMNPAKQHNMQRAWPGNPAGHETERLAYALDQAVLRHCTHFVDMHCWEHVKAAESLTQSDHAPSRAMGEAATTRFISYRPTSVPAAGTMMVSQWMLKGGRASLTIELSGQYQMNERQVTMGLSSMINIAKVLGMIEGPPERVDGPRVVRSRETSHDVRAPCAGIFMPARRADQTATLGPEDHVSKGQELGHLIREGDLVRVPVVAPVTGYLWQFGLCHWNQCDASLPALHPYTEEREVIAMVVTGE